MPRMSINGTEKRANNFAKKNTKLKDKPHQGDTKEKKRKKKNMENVLSIVNEWKIEDLFEWKTVTPKGVCL